MRFELWREEVVEIFLFVVDAGVEGVDDAVAVFAVDAVA